MLDRLYDRLDGHDRQAGSDLKQLETELWRQYGRKGSVLVLDMSGTSKATRESGLVPLLLRIRRMQRLTAPLVDEHGGSVVKFEADNLFAFFAHVKQALACAIAIQTKLARYNTGREPQWRIEACIGIAQGRAIVVPEHDFFGDCVNVAARLGEDLAKPGEILVATAAVARLSPGHGFRVQSIQVEDGDILTPTTRIIY